MDGSGPGVLGDAHGLVVAREPRREVDRVERAALVEDQRERVPSVRKWSRRVTLDLRSACWIALVRATSQDPSQRESEPSLCDFEASANQNLAHHTALQRFSFFRRIFPDTSKKLK